MQACQLARGLPFYKWHMRLLEHIRAFHRGWEESDHWTAFTHGPCGWYSWLEAGFWTTDLWVDVERQILEMVASVPSGILDKVYDPSPRHQSTYCNADSTPPDTLGGDRARFTASAVAPESASVCQLPGYHIDQPHSWHARGGWVPSPIFCKIQPRSTHELCVLGCSWRDECCCLSQTSPSDLREGWGRHREGAAGLSGPFSACLPPASQGSFQVAYRSWLTEMRPFQVGCGMRGQEP